MSYLGGKKDWIVGEAMGGRRGRISKKPMAVGVGAWFHHSYINNHGL